MRQLQRRPRPADSYEDEDEPRGARSQLRRNGKTSSGRNLDQEDTGIVTKGWGGYKRMKEEAPSKWEKLYKPPEGEEGLIKFLEDDPYANVIQHWVEEVKNGQKGFICLGKSNDCPLCDMGHTPNAFARFNVLDLSADEPILVVYQTGITITETIKKHAEGRMGPLTNPELYFACTMNVTGKGGKGQKRQAIRPVKARDLEEDFGWGPPLNPSELQYYVDRCYNEEGLRKSTREELEAVAELLA